MQELYCFRDGVSFVHHFALREMLRCMRKVTNM